jgi:ATP-dependent DNA helicase RecG
MKYRESETIELKRSTSELKEAVISIAAILNKHGRGEAYFGIRNDGAVIGQQVGGKTLHGVSQAISENIEPKIYPKIQGISIGNRSCIRVNFEGKDAPYFAFGRAYMRVADEDRQMSAREIERLIIKKNKDKLRWDSEICPRAKLSDISPRKLKNFLKIAGLKHDSLFNSLSKLRLLSGKKPLNTAIIMFAKKPQDFFPNAKLRCAVFGKTDTSLIIDRKEFEGNILYLIEKAQEYILENIHIGMRIEGLRRIDVPEIDKEAFREAIINAFCHRDYWEYDSVNIAIFKDRLEIRNPGLLYGDLTIEKITTEMVSERRNELIADLFHRIHFIERWGRGIRLILSKEPQTIFKEVGTHFIVVFKRKTEAQRKEITAEEETTQKTTQKIISIIKSDPQVSRKRLARKIGLTEDGIKYHLAQLKKKGIVKRIGPDKGGYWKIIKIES